jgi:hypothetical protein
MMSEAPKTPAAKWRQEGQADPHGDHYNCQRAALTLGEPTDDELANGVFLHGNEPLNINALLRKTPGYHSAVVWLTAGKDRIRWLSRSLEESTAREQALQLRLNAADQRIDELTAKQHPSDSVCKGSIALGNACGKCARCLAAQPSAIHGAGEVKIKGMVEAIGDKFAIMIDEANAHYGRTFQRHPDGMWVSGRKATDAEMHAARTHAHITNQQ